MGPYFLMSSQIGYGVLQQIQSNTRVTQRNTPGTT
jgi:hypothetical protein